MSRTSLVGKTVLNSSTLTDLRTVLGTKRTHTNPLVALWYIEDLEINAHDAVREDSPYRQMIYYTFATVVPWTDIQYYIFDGISTTFLETSDQTLRIMLATGHLESWRRYVCLINETFADEVKQLLIDEGFALLFK